MLTYLKFMNVLYSTYLVAVSQWESLHKTQIRSLSFFGARSWSAESKATDSVLSPRCNISEQKDNHTLVFDFLTRARCARAWDNTPYPNASFAKSLENKGFFRKFTMATMRPVAQER